ncbi:MAG: glycosyltransferase [Flavobacterium sp.]
MTLEIIFYAFVGVVFLQALYYLVVFGNFSFRKVNQPNPKKIPVSIIVCAKNEAENVKHLIPALLSQDYPDFEVVLIDDSSSDETLDIFEEFEKTSSRIKLVKVVNNEAFWGNKKFALTLGIKAAKNEYLLFTDADCLPVSNQWLKEMSAHFTLKKTIVLGYGGYEKIKGSFLNKLIRFETLLTATQYLGWAAVGKPYMGVGRNLAYKREEFFKTNGFINHMKIRSGDDDLFINEAAHAENTTYSVSPQSFTTSKPKTSFKDWFTQKRRHVSTAKHYKGFDRFQLGLFYLTQLSFYLLAILLLILQFQWVWVASIIGFRFLFAWLVMGKAANKLKETDVIYFYPVIELILIGVQLNVFITNIFSKPVHWK